MRTIKFKGKEIEKPHRWIIGDLYQEKGSFFIWHRINNQSFPIEVDEKSVGQFTGMEDAYGNEIFEGDILHIPDDDFNGEIKGVVMFEADSFVVKSIRSNWSALLAWCNRKDHETKHYVRPTKVIGNTYDNPELLK